MPFLFCCAATRGDGSRRRDVAHGQRQASTTILPGSVGFSDMRTDRAFGNAEFIHDIANEAGAFAKRDIALHRAIRRFSK